MKSGYNDRTLKFTANQRIAVAVRADRSVITHYGIDIAINPLYYLYYCCRNERYSLSLSLLRAAARQPNGHAPQFCA